MGNYSSLKSKPDATFIRILQKIAITQQNGKRLIELSGATVVVKLKALFYYLTKKNIAFDQSKKIDSQKVRIGEAKLRLIMNNSNLMHLLPCLRYSSEVLIYTFFFY